MSILFSHFLSNHNEISPQESNFTEVLCDIALVPKLLYFYGKIPKKRLKTVAIVGTRRPTEYGKRIAYELAYAAARAGAVVVSGMAYGIDSIAHRGALDAGGLTIAVLGTPIDKIYPEAHVGLAEEIVKKGGAVISEMPPGAEFFPKTSFLERNRLISGLADVVVIAEAAEHSGSLNTAAHALEQGRDIFAVPGDIMREMSGGTNQLIAKSGAMPYLKKEDVIDVLFPERQRKRARTPPRGDTEAERAVLGALEAGTVDGEDILTKVGISASEFNQTMTMLEVKGYVRALGMNQWAIV